MDDPDSPLTLADDGEPAEPSEGDVIEAVHEPDEPATGFDAAPAVDQAALAALVRRVMGQDEAALAELYRHLANRVFRQAHRLVRDIATAEELVEDVFWQVWRQAARYEAARGPVLAWVMQITRSRALDALRARGRNPLHAALSVDDAQEPVAEAADPQQLLAQAQVGASVMQALALLDPLRRQLVSLAFERGYSQSEIAEQTGLPLGTVKSHIRRALETMKKTMEEALAPGAGGRA